MSIGMVSAAQDYQNIKTSDNSTLYSSNIDTDVDADDVAVEHKKNGFFKVKVKNDDTDRPIKNLKIKLKIFTKSKSKTYKIKTNSKGIAKFNTKNLKMGKHKVIITSSDDNYPINKKANIYVGKKNTISFNGNYKKLKNKDTIKIHTKHDDDEKEVKLLFKGKSKHTVILKAKFFLKNKNTGKTIIKKDTVEFDDGKWDMPDADYSYKYSLTKVKVSYISYW